MGDGNESGFSINPLDIFGLGVSGGSAIANYKLGQDQIDYLKWAQKRTWEREDTAAQRRAADLESAGLSKTLAAGGAAASSGPISVPRNEFDATGISRSVQDIYARKEIGQKIAQSREDILNMRAQREATIANTARINAETDRINQDIGFKNQLNPLRLMSQQLKNDFDSLANPVRLDKMKADLDKVGVEKKSLQIKQRLDQAHISKMQFEVVGMSLDNVLKTKNITEAEKRIMIAEVTLEIDKLLRDTKSHDLEIWNRLKLPSTSNLDASWKAASYFSGLWSEYYDGLEKPVPETHDSPARGKIIGGAR